MTLYKRLFKNIVGKGEIVGSQIFSFFPQCFLSDQIDGLPFEQYLICRLQMLLIWPSPKFCHLVKVYLYHRNKQKYSVPTDILEPWMNRDIFFMETVLQNQTGHQHFLIVPHPFNPFPNNKFKTLPN